MVYGLGGILLGEFALFANAIEELPSGGELGDDVVLVSRLEPVDELDDVRVLQALEHVQLIEDHALVSLHILLEDDLDSHPTGGALGLPDDAVGTRAEGLAKAILRSCELGKMVST